MSSFIVGLETARSFLSRIWEGYKDYPDYTHRAFIRIPMSLNGTTYADPLVAKEALIQAINTMDNNTTFTNHDPTHDKAVSKDGNTSLHIVRFRGDENDYIKLSFRTREAAFQFSQDARSQLEGLEGSIGGLTVTESGSLKTGFFPQRWGADTSPGTAKNGPF